MRPATTRTSAPRVSASLRRLLAVLGAVVILAGLLINGAGRPADVFGAGGANALDHFTVAGPATATAGVAFTVTVTAFDRRDRIVTDYVGVPGLSGLAASPNANAPSYGSGTWLNGVGTFSSVTAYKSQAGATVTYTDTATSIPPATSAPVTVLPSTVTVISFITQPVDTKFNATISSSLAGFVAVKVLALDTYGNRVNGVSVTIDDNNPGVLLAGTDKTVVTVGGTPGVAPFGEASFSTLSLPTLGTYTLGATAGSLTATSLGFEIVADLAKCTGSSCKNTGEYVSNVPQKTYGTITPGGSSFSNNVVLTTQFAGNGASQCTIGTGTDDNLVFGQTTEVRVQDTVSSGTGISSTQPDFQVALLYPSQTLQALGITSRGVPSFEVCLGATWIGASGGDTPWQAKDLTTGGLVDAQEAGTSNVYWGWVPDCASVAAFADNPCFELRTKSSTQLQSTLNFTKQQLNALGYKSGDLALVIRKPFPWDGKFTAR